MQSPPRPSPHPAPRPAAARGLLFRPKRIPWLLWLKSSDVFVVEIQCSMLEYSPQVVGNPEIAGVLGGTQNVGGVFYLKTTPWRSWAKPNWSARVKIKTTRISAPSGWDSLGFDSAFPILECPSKALAADPWAVEI